MPATSRPRRRGMNCPARNRAGIALQFSAVFAPSLALNRYCNDPNCGVRALASCLVSIAIVPETRPKHDYRGLTCMGEATGSATTPPPDAAVADRLTN